MKKKIIFIALVCSIFCAAFTQENSVEQRVISIYSSVHDYDMNPYTAATTSEAQLFTGLYEGLFTYDPKNLSPVKALCTDYKISRDKKRWTFTIRSDAKFSDGTVITADHVKNSWLNLLKTPYAPFASMFDSVTGAAEFRQGKCAEEDVRIVARDKNTLVVYLNEPVSHFKKILCHHAYSVVSEKKGVYSGPFVLESYSKKNMELKKNENYWDAERVKIPGIKYTFVTEKEEKDVPFLYNNGEIDWIEYPTEIKALINKDAIKSGTQFCTMYFFFKQNNEPWNHVEFRKALLDAVPYDKLREGSFDAAETLVPSLPGYPSVSGYSDSDVDDAILQMNKARKMYNVPQNEKLQLVFAISDDPYWEKMANLLKKAWEPLGVELTVQTAPYYQYNSSIETWNADMFFYSWVGDFADPIAFLELFRGDSSLNVAKYKNEEFDKALSEAVLKDGAYSLYAKAEQILLDDAEVIPVHHPLSLNVIDTEQVGGWAINALDIHPLKYLYIKALPKVSIPNLVMLRDSRR